MVAAPGDRYGTCTGGVVVLGRPALARDRNARGRVRAAGPVRPPRDLGRGMGADADGRGGYRRAHPAPTARTWRSFGPPVPAPGRMGRHAHRLPGVGGAIDVPARAHDVGGGVRIPLVAPPRRSAGSTGGWKRSTGAHRQRRASRSSSRRRSTSGPSFTGIGKLRLPRRDRASPSSSFGHNGLAAVRLTPSG
jgi:hypothetical protein